MAITLTGIDARRHRVQRSFNRSLRLAFRSRPTTKIAAPTSTGHLLMWFAGGTVQRSSRLHTQSTVRVRHKIRSTPCGLTGAALSYSSFRFSNVRSVEGIDGGTMCRVFSNSTLNGIAGYCSAPRTHYATDHRTSGN